MPLMSSSVGEKPIQKVISQFLYQMQYTFSVQQRRPRVIVLAGATGTGKSALAMQIAREYGAEIVSADSMQVYRGMDIGTAKPSLDEQQEIPHHMIDIRDVRERFNVVDFYYQARLACQQVHERGKIPIVVGGSGFYLHALIYGPPSGPPSLPELREALQSEIETLGADALYERLQALDPAYAATITKHDKQKIVRGLEIMALTNVRVSELSWKEKRRPQNFDFRCWFLYRPKEELYALIEQRCDAMLQAGLVDEVRQLLPQGLEENSSAVQAIGYRQVLEFLRTPCSQSDYKKFVHDFKQATRQYAKRQYTWFRNKETLFRWVDVTQVSRSELIDRIMQDYLPDPA